MGVQAVSLLEAYEKHKKGYILYFTEFYGQLKSAGLEIVPCPGDPSAEDLEEVKNGTRDFDFDSFRLYSWDIVETVSNLKFVKTRTIGKLFFKYHSVSPGVINPMGLELIDSQIWKVDLYENLEVVSRLWEINGKLIPVKQNGVFIPINNKFRSRGGV